MKTLILTDNPYAYELAQILENLHGNIDTYQSPTGPLSNVPRINVKKQLFKIIETYDLVISIHCKQFFPPTLVREVRCVNVHPGLNPYNRGWYPQVFSILNGLPAGVTIHEIDEQLDHGAIIVQREYEIEPWDTSGSVYARLMEIERELVLEYYVLIRDKTYQATLPLTEGNINYKKDFEELKRLDMDQVDTFQAFLNRLRALTHDNFRNAYFVDETGRKTFVRVILEPEDTSSSLA